MNSLGKIRKIESILTQKNISLEFPVRPGLGCTVYANKSGKHEIWLTRTIFQNLDSKTPTLFVLDDYPLTDVDDELQEDVLDLLRRHLRHHFNYAPALLWQKCSIINGDNL